MNLETARQHVNSATRVAVLTGAGVSAESGIPTFREVQTGYWAQFSPEELASPAAYAKDPQHVWNWYASRYETCERAAPNDAHRALAKLETAKGNEFVLVTQNVDGLHARAGSKQIIELHGNLRTACCERCGTLQALPAPEAFTPPPTCTICGSRMRPNVVWFGENLAPAALEVARVAFAACEVALVVGTSSVVEPASSLPLIAKQNGAVLIEVNPEVTPLSKFCDLRVNANASSGLTALIEG